MPLRQILQLIAGWQQADASHWPSAEPVQKLDCRRSNAAEAQASSCQCTLMRLVSLLQGFARRRSASTILPLTSQRTCLVALGLTMQTPLSMLTVPAL